MREDDGMSAAQSPERPEVVLVTRPAAGSDTARSASPAEVLREVISHSVGLATFTATTAAEITQQAVGAIAASGLRATYRGAQVVLDPVLDAVVPRVTDAILDRVNLTEIVLERVDIDAIVAKADMNAIIDRVPIVPIADYVIDEIDLPQIIRQSTGGIATQAINSVRVQSFGADQWIARVTDSIVRRTKRRVDAPGDPESLDQWPESPSPEGAS